jgi:hypothetical protein
MYLTDAYGKPDFVSSVPYQNGFGARFEYLEAKWSLPDGAEIHIIEKPSPITSGTYIQVIFRSRERVQLLDAVTEVERANNPYKSK